MRTNTFLALLTSLLLCAAAAAQTKTSGTIQCGKADQDQTIEIGDHPGHEYWISKYTCGFTKPWEIEGVKAKQYLVWDSGEGDGGKVNAHGYSVVVMENGDRTVGRYGRTGTIKEDGSWIFRGTWTTTSGTGKLKGIKQKGTLNCKGDANSVTCDVEGEYLLPAK